MSEGIDFRDEKGRVVIITGVVSGLIMFLSPL
jgi:hypothetical protein